MENLRTVKRYHLSKDGSGWNFTIKQDGRVYGEIFQKGTVQGFIKQESPELFANLKSFLHVIPCATSMKPDKILVLGDKNEEGDFVALDGYENYDHDSPEASLWRHLESLAKRIIEKAL